jgi:anti-sigma regulatory factor (Ser/Thr protein kinase)
MDATAENLPVVGAVATGAGEALGLHLEPAVRLHTIAVEAAGNVVAHAYPEGGDCKMEVQICRDDGELHVRVCDAGVGVRIPPGGCVEPGLGLSMISSLAESYSLHSGVSGGTRLEATIDPDATHIDRGGDEAPSPTHASALEFSDPVFIKPVLGRALAAEMSSERLQLDRLDQALQVGDVIAEGIVEEGLALPELEFSERGRPHELLIRVAPAVAATADRLAGTLRRRLGKAIPSLRIDSHEGWAVVALPI